MQYHLITDRPALPCRYCFYSVVQKQVLRPAGATRCPDKCEIWHGERTAPLFPISHLLGQKCGNTAPKTVNILNFGHMFAPQGSLVCTIFTKFSDFLFGHFRRTNNQVISIFPWWGPFALKFQQPLVAKLLLRSKNFWGGKNGTVLFYHHAKYGGDRGSCTGCRRKSVIFLSVCLFVMLWNYEVCDNGNTIKQ